MNRDFTPPKADIDGLQKLAYGVGIIGILALAAGAAFQNLEQGLRSYLLGFVFWTGISVGCLGILMLQHLIQGAWGLVVRRVAEAGAKNIINCGYLFIPLMLGIDTLYGAWTHADGDLIIAKKAAYLNHTFFGIRTIIYFAVWSFMAYMLNKWSDEQDRTGNLSLGEKMRNFSGPMMCIYILAVTFAAIDWVMTLDPHWFSAIFGFLFVIGWALSCMAFMIAILSWLANKEPMNRVLGARHFHDVGKLMLAFVMIWAYFNFSQLLIIWSGNIPEETPWYLARMSGAYGYIGLGLILFHFILPFVLLLSRDLKRNYKSLVGVAVFILVMRLVDLFYLIGPTASHGGHNAGFNLSWMDFVAPIGIGGIWLGLFLAQLKKKPLMPPNDPYLENAISHGKGH